MPTEKLYCDICGAEIRIGDMYYTDLDGHEFICCECIDDVLEDIKDDHEHECMPSDLEVFGWHD